jgi:hypothetical protein
MQTFQHGQEIEVHLGRGVWARRWYVGRNPRDNTYAHIYVHDDGMRESCVDSNIRPIPAETWVPWTHKTRPPLSSMEFRKLTWCEGITVTAAAAGDYGLAINGTSNDEFTSAPTLIAYDILLTSGEWVVSYDGGKTFTRCGIKS